LEVTTPFNGSAAKKTGNGKNLYNPFARANVFVTGFIKPGNKYLFGCENITDAIY
jgi:hypothetical protein